MLDTGMTNTLNRVTGFDAPSMTQLGMGIESSLGLGPGGGTTITSTNPEIQQAAVDTGLSATRRALAQQSEDQAAAQAAADAEAEKIKAWRGEQNRQGRASTILGGRKVYIGGGVGTSARRTLLPA